MRYLFLAFVIAGCTPSTAVHRSAEVKEETMLGAGEACDLNGVDECDAGLVCTSSGVCDGPVCGNGNVVCSGATVCTQAADCIPPCLAGGAAVYRPGTGCEARGLITTADGRCVVPCWYELCDVLGGGCS